MGGAVLHLRVYFIQLISERRIIKSLGRQLQVPQYMSEILERTQLEEVGRELKKIWYRKREILLQRTTRS